MEARNLSYWEAKSLLPKADVFILGGGLVGLSAAISLKERNPKLKVCVIDRFVFPQGASTKNAGFACFGSVSEILDDLSRLPEKEVVDLIRARWEGLQILRSRLGDKVIDYKGVGGYEIFRYNEQPLFEKCQQQIGYLNKLIEDHLHHERCFSSIDPKNSAVGIQPVDGLIFNRMEGVLDTGKMINALILKAKRMSIHLLYGMPIDRIEFDAHAKDIILQNNIGWKLKASKLIIATNGFTRQILPDVEVKAVRNQVLVTSPIKGLKLKGGFHLDRGYFYLRNIENRILIGGGRNLDFEGETTDQFGLNASIIEKLEQLVRDLVVIDQPYQFDFKWSGILGVGETKSPIVKRVNQSLVIGVRLGGMGVALGSKIGAELADLILD